MKTIFFGLLLILCSQATVFAQSPEQSEVGQVQALETAVLDSLSAQDAANDSPSQDFRGGVSGGTHMLVGASMMAASLVVGNFMATSSQDTSPMIALMIPGIFVIGGFEFVYGMVRVFTSKNDFN